ncbi:pyridoxamine 5'-phosphate oxidase family protein [Sphingoaurantiacus capsulatus]|uniref:Pyridoxamine 5'-phosphate oxidase family protein n=1 Tax=Sphingoaurantiacus capsulatus TaxID=1771310 RepID=A0ABV7X8Q7_9SPHN
MHGNDVDSVAALESCIGASSPMIDLKVIDHLDRECLRWLAASPLMFASLGRDGNVTATLAGGAAGFASGHHANLHLPLAAIDDPALIQVGDAFGSLFLIPGIGETLRINSRVAAIEAGTARVAVEEAYIHCAKALIRSDFWKATPADAPTDATDFVAASRFMALATLGAAGGADLSPKGDPAGAMARLDGATLRYADRPGNRRADSFRNILTQPRIAGALLVPGATRVAILHGVARLSADADERARFVVKEKTPVLVTTVDDVAIELRDSPALARASLWPAAPAPDIDPAKILVAHMKLNRDKGLQAKLAGAVLSVPGLMKKGLEKDYATNLY